MMKRDESTQEFRWIRWRVTGRVQGVGFRWFVQRAATDHQVVGDICNLPDGSVEIRARGTKSELDRLLAVVREGPDRARVDDVEKLHPEPSDAILDFEVRHLRD